MENHDQDFFLQMLKQIEAKKNTGEKESDIAKYISTTFYDQKDREKASAEAKLKEKLAKEKAEESHFMEVFERIIVRPENADFLTKAFETIMKLPAVQEKMKAEFAAQIKSTPPSAFRPKWPKSKKEKYSRENDGRPSAAGNSSVQVAGNGFGRSAGNGPGRSTGNGYGQSASTGFSNSGAPGGNQSANQRFMNSAVPEFNQYANNGFGQYAGRNSNQPGGHDFGQFSDSNHQGQFVDQSDGGFSISQHDNYNRNF